MTEFSLTVNTDNPADIRAILDVISGNRVSAAPITSNDDDDSGPVNTAAPMVDSTGLPWDERIHAKTKSQNKDGTWKRGRNIDDATVAAVESELRARAANPIPQAQQAPVPQPNAQPVAQQTPAFTQPPGQYMAPQPQVAPTSPQVAPVQPQTAQPPQPSPAQPGALDFNALMQGLQRGMAGGKIDVQYLGQLVNELNGAWGVQFTQITDLVNRPDMIPYAVQCLQRDGRWLA